MIRMCKAAATLLPCMVLLFAFGGCGGGGDIVAGGGGGITGTGVSAGQITGFGSVVVNGIRYGAGSGASIRFAADDSVLSRTESDLQQGMIVTVRGNFDESLGSGTYDSIEFAPELKGPVGTVNPVAGTMTVLGRTILVDAATVFTGAGVTGPESLQPDDLAEVSGYFTDSDMMVLRATRIFKEKAGFEPTLDRVALRGTVGPNPGESSFTVGGLTVNFTADVTDFINMIPTELAANLVVDISGTLSGTTVTALRITRKSAAAGAVSAEPVRFKGIASGAVDPAGGVMLLTPNGQLRVVTTAATKFKNGAAATMAKGIRLQAEGALNAEGELAAASISFELNNNIKLEGNIIQVGDVDPVAGTVKINGITVITNGLTMLKDSSSAEVRKFSLADIGPGDHLQVGGFLDPSGLSDRIVATKVERRNGATPVFIQGPVAGASKPNLTLLGVTVVTGVTTIFLQVDDIPFPTLPGLTSQEAFFATLVPGVTIVKAKGNVVGATLNATDAEIEP